MKMLITDLDNTLYDWVTFFSKAFKAMIDELANELGVEENELLKEFKEVHQYYGNTEQPFSIFEIRSVKEKYSFASKSELLEILNKPLYAFNKTRKQYMQLYDSVQETLCYLKEQGIKIIGHTESIPINAYFRIKKLNIDGYFNRLYALEGKYEQHPNPARRDELKIPPDFIRIIPKDEKKPNPKLLINICQQEGIEQRNVYYVGDSLVKDMAMAKEAGVTSIWAKYGMEYDKDVWKYLVLVTHWTKDDVKHEEDLKNKYKDVKPDFTIGKFEEIKTIIL